MATASAYPTYLTISELLIAFPAVSFFCLPAENQQWAEWLDGADPNILKDSDQVKLTRQDLALLVAFATGWAPFATTPQPLSEGFWPRCANPVTPTSVN